MFFYSTKSSSCILPSSMQHNRTTLQLKKLAKKYYIVDQNYYIIDFNDRLIDGDALISANEREFSYFSWDLNNQHPVLVKF